MTMQQQEPSRPWQPAAGPEAYRTYRMLSPPQNRRRASCEEVDCERWRHGWLTALDVADPKAAEAANWIRMKSGRKFTFEEVGTAVTFTFPAGQQCFKPHSVPERPFILLVQGGDWRGNPRRVPTVRHSTMDDWVDDFATNQQAIRDRIERG